MIQHVFDSHHVEESKIHHNSSVVKWADIEKGIPPEQHEIEAVEEEDDEVLPINVAQAKLDRLEKPLIIVTPADKKSAEADLEIDTLEAHASLIKMREQIKADIAALKDQPNPFLPEGDLAKEAETIVVKMKYNSSLEYESLSLESPQQSEDFGSTDLNFTEDSPVKSVDKLKLAEEGLEECQKVAIVNHGLIISAKTENVERVVIPEKGTKCCLIL